MQILNQYYNELIDSPTLRKNAMLNSNLSGWM